LTRSVAEVLLTSIIFKKNFEKKIFFFKFFKNILKKFKKIILKKIFISEDRYCK